MADTMRWRWGDTQAVQAPVLKHTAIAVGDLVVQSYEVDETQGHAFPVSSMPAGRDWGFLGVAMRRKEAGGTSPLVVATAGVFEFDCLSSTFNIGDYVVFDREDGRFLDQRVRISCDGLSVGLVAAFSHAVTTHVLVEIRSDVMRRMSLGGQDG